MKASIEKMGPESQDDSSYVSDWLHKKINLINKCRKDQEAVMKKLEDYLENISYQSNMLITLINDLLDLAKFETMNFKFNEEFFDLNQVIK